MSIEYQYDGEPINEYREMLKERINYLQEHMGLAMDEVKDDETKYALGDIDNLIELIKQRI